MYPQKDNRENHWKNREIHIDPYSVLPKSLFHERPWKYFEVLLIAQIKVEGNVRSCKVNYVTICHLMMAAWHMPCPRFYWDAFHCLPDPCHAQDSKPEAQPEVQCFGWFAIFCICLQYFANNCTCLHHFEPLTFRIFRIIEVCLGYFRIVLIY